MELGKARSSEEIIKDIKSTLETKVKDNVAVHGGEINFLSYEKGIVRLRMWYADIRGHHGKKWDYEPSKHYMKKK